MYGQGGSGSNEILSLAEAAERLGLDGRSRPDRSVVRRMRRLEQDTGRRILVESGEGKGRRYLVLSRELDAALDGETKIDVDSLADTIAMAVQRIEARVERVASGLDALTRRVARLEGAVPSRF